MAPKKAVRISDWKSVGDTPGENAKPPGPLRVPIQSSDSSESNHKLSKANESLHRSANDEDSESEAEESCIVYGMPKEAAATGMVEQIVPLPRMWQEILEHCRIQ